MLSANIYSVEKARDLEVFSKQLHRRKRDVRCLNDVFRKSGKNSWNVLCASKYSFTLFHESKLVETA